MRLHIISQVIEHYHEFVKNYSDNPRNDFSTDESEVEDPMGGNEGVTTYDIYNFDPDYLNPNKEIN